MAKEQNQTKKPKQSPTPKQATKGVPVVAIVLVVIVVAVIGIVAWKVVSNKKESTSTNNTTNPYVAKYENADDIEIKDSDTNEVKIEKLQGKIELLTNEIDEKEEKLNAEYEKINELYEEYVSIMNEYQTGTEVEEITETEEPTEE